MFVCLPLKPGVTIQNAAMDWLDSRKSYKSYRDDKNRYDKHLAPSLGHRHLEKVNERARRRAGKSLEVPLVPSLVAVLKKWKAKRDPSQPLVVPPDARLVNMGRADGKVVRFAGPSAIQNALDVAFAKLKMRRLTFYEAGRHTFASNWVLAGLDVYRLSQIMGHASVMTTERYAHLAKKVPDAMLALADVKLAS